MAIKLFSAITVPARNFFSSIINARTGVAKFATLYDLNTLAQSINQLVNYRPWDVKFTNSGVPILNRVTMLAGECNRNCSSDCTLCGCYPTCSNETTTAIDLIMTNTGAGTYTLVANLGKSDTYDYTNLKGVGIFPSALKLPTHAIGISEVLPAVPGHITWNIITTEAGVPANNIIEDVILQFRFYGAIYNVFD
jgi:hypothetical protein